MMPHTKVYHIYLESSTAFKSLKNPWRLARFFSKAFSSWNRFSTKSGLHKVWDTLNILSCASSITQEGHGFGPFLARFNNLWRFSQLWFWIFGLSKSTLNWVNISTWKKDTKQATLLLILCDCERPSLNLIASPK